MAGRTLRLIVLQWLAQLPRTWTSFVDNRISEIQQIFSRANWNHVKSNSNPADCASRGTLVKDLIDTSLWWHGPDWLSQPESTWPQPSSTVNEENKQQIESEKKHKRFETVASAVIAHQPWIDISRYSSLWKLQRIIATIIKASHLFKDASKEVSVTPQLLNQAKLILLRQHQAQYYATDLAVLTTGKEFPRNSKILNISPFLDEDTGTIRVGGRLAQSQIHHDQKFPYLVHSDSHLAILILRYFHEATLHGGGQLTLNSSRSEYWIWQRQELLQQSHQKLCEVQ